MSNARTARWASRAIALAMVVVCLVVLKVMGSQLRRMGARLPGARAEGQEGIGGGAGARAEARSEARSEARPEARPEARGTAARGPDAGRLQPPSAGLPSPSARAEPPKPGEPLPEDSPRGVLESSPADAALAESLPEPGVVPEGAVW